MKLPRKFIDEPANYKSIEDVPEGRRLQKYGEVYSGRDLWAEYFNDVYSHAEYSDRHIRRLNKAEVEWKAHCDNNHRHHALTSPEIVNTWCVELLTRMTCMSVWNQYLCCINQFYRYLLWHVDHPHCYNPIQFAIRQYSTTRQIWKGRPGGEDR